MDAYDTRKQNTLSVGSKEACQQSRALIATMFYTGGLLLLLAKNCIMWNHLFAADLNIGGFVLLIYNALRTLLLDETRTYIEELLVPIKGIWKEEGIIIIFDGWCG